MPDCPHPPQHRYQEVETAQYNREVCSRCRKRLGAVPVEGRRFSTPTEAEPETTAAELLERMAARHLTPVRPERN